MIQMGTVGQWGTSPGDTVLLTQREEATFCWSEWSPEEVLSAFKTGDTTVLDMLPKEMGKWTQKRG